MFQIPGIPVSNSRHHRTTSPRPDGARHQTVNVRPDAAKQYDRSTQPYRHPAQFTNFNTKTTDEDEDEEESKSSLTKHWVNVHANSFQPIVREKRTPSADKSNALPLYGHATDQPIVSTYADEIADTRDGEEEEEEEEEKAADKITSKDEDADADEEVESILDEKRLEQRYDQRRRLKRQRSLSRMSVARGGRKTPARFAKRRRLNDGGAFTTEPATNTKSVLSSIIKYAKYPVYISLNIASISVMLSCMGVDMSQYTNLIRVSTSMLRHVAATNGIDVLRRLTAGALASASELGSTLTYTD